MNNQLTPSLKVFVGAEFEAFPDTNVDRGSKWYMYWNADVSFGVAHPLYLSEKNTTTAALRLSLLSPPIILFLAPLCCSFLPAGQLQVKTITKMHEKAYNTDIKQACVQEFAYKDFPITDADGTKSVLRLGDLDTTQRALVSKGTLSSQLACARVCADRAIRHTRGFFFQFPKKSVHYLGIPSPRPRPQPRSRRLFNLFHAAYMVDSAALLIYSQRVRVSGGFFFKQKDVRPPTGHSIRPRPQPRARRLFNMFHAAYHLFDSAALAANVFTARAHV